MSKENTDEFWSFVSSYLFSAGMMSFSVGLLRAAMFGFVGGLAGMLARAFWFKLFPKK